MHLLQCQVLLSLNMLLHHDGVLHRDILCVLHVLIDLQSGMLFVGYERHEAIHVIIRVRVTGTVRTWHGH